MSATYFARLTLPGVYDEEAIFSRARYRADSSHHYRRSPITPRAGDNYSQRLVDSLSSRAVRDGLSPGLGVAITMDGRTVLSKSYGMADGSAGIRAETSTLWYLASTSKWYPPGLPFHFLRLAALCASMIRSRSPYRASTYMRRSTPIR